MSAVSTGSTPEATIGSTAGGPLPTEDFCGHCGEAYDGGECPPSYAHQRCRERLAMEPPRYCAACRRRMKVQVTPLGWTAECSRHGVLAS
ncbi:biotin synthase auxiliary protein BsaP [Arthrobacter sp. 9AX]|uniref:biotin synthase auxiliary protein BsaP n=1 Tax=Arthrobacter sp. 9AX TaxID=2653131 RepID=UPI003FA4312B